MKQFFPGYYRDFHCIAQDCPDSCCKEWAVDVDPQTAAFYRGLQSDLGDALRRVLQDTEDGTVMTIQDGRCPMWRQDGLCRIQAELGHGALCKTCRDFPRLTHDYGNFRELGLELSCPEAARLILTANNYTFVAQDVSDSQEADYDRELMDILLSSRDAALDFWDQAAYPPEQALAILLLYAHSVQGWIDGGEPVALEPSICLADARRFAGRPDISSLRDFFAQLEILTPQWESQLAGCRQKWSWNLLTAPLCRYFLQRYWLQSVADYDLVGRVKFLVAACVLVNALDGDFCKTAQLFSKEIENDPDNVDAILDGCYASPALTDANLLALLLKN